MCKQAGNITPVKLMCPHCAVSCDSRFFTRVSCYLLAIPAGGFLNSLPGMLGYADRPAVPGVFSHPVVAFPDHLIPYRVTLGMQDRSGVPHFNAFFLHGTYRADQISARNPFPNSLRIHFSQSPHCRQIAGDNCYDKRNGGRGRPLVYHSNYHASICLQWGDLQYFNRF